MAGVFIVIIQCLILFFGGMALIVFVYCGLTNKVFKELYPKTVEGVVAWFLDELRNKASSSSSICRMDREYIDPIVKVLGENGCPCVERNAIIFVTQQVAHYEMQLSDKVKELDLSYMEKLLQVVFYNEILPLYQNVGVRKEDIDVFIRREEKILFIYIGHCQKAYMTINSYRNEVKQRNIEKLNKECEEMVE